MHLQVTQGQLRMRKIVQIQLQQQLSYHVEIVSKVLEHTCFLQIFCSSLLVLKFFVEPTGIVWSKNGHTALTFSLLSL